MVETDKPTVVDAHAVFEGKLKGKDVQVLGKFKGEIELSGRLMMGEGSRVEAKVVAEQADIAGEFSGDLKVRSLILLEKARVEGTLEAQNLAVREGAQLNGSVSSGSAASGYATVKSEASATAASAGKTEPRAEARPIESKPGEVKPGPPPGGVVAR
jgi:cytoskeletal protein CcmA (bactofilin family)